MADTVKHKKYPDSLHMYKIWYDDQTERTIYANGTTHAVAISKECWPQSTIKHIIICGDSWKTNHD